ncbi:MAG: hypothetical protein KY476_26550, partial [Planctomycetes bacterium]|nr:hypothetical protein [Planctomycetota bacterium]
DANAGNKLDYVRLRRFVISALGDAAAYQQVGTAANNTYQLVHERIRLGIQDLSAAVRSDRLQPVSSGNDAPVPLVIMAHSLGGHIVSNYIWDVQQRRRRGGTAGSDFEDFETLSGMVTFGCNVPLFTFAYSQVVPIEFPPASLPTDLRAKAKWLNFYDPDDVLGYPLKTINAAYAAVVTEDLPINAGGVLSSWNPASHEGYWTDNDFTRPVAAFLAEFLRPGAGT